MYSFYSLLLGLALVLLSPYLLLRGWRQGKYLGSLRERLGRVPERIGQPKRGAFWVHAVSVGEALAVAPLLGELRRRFPERRLLVSTTTRTGQELAARRLGADATFYFPLDFRFACRRFLRAVQPELILVAETEIWPNFLRAAREAGARVVWVNGRISERSFRGYRRVRFFWRRVLKDVDLFLMQTEEDAERLRALGAPAERVQVAGNLKFDLLPPPRPEFLPELERLAQGAPVLVAGSTLAGEEEILLDAVETLRRVYGERVWLVLAPRHPERFEAVAKLLGARGVRFLRRSQGFPADSRAEVLLLDTLGELAGTYAAATLAFVGGSLVSGGGHNPIEPALWGKPVVFGPSMEHFRNIARAFLQAQAAFQVRGAEELAALLAALLRDRGAVARSGGAARALVERERGAAARSANRLEALLRPRAEPARLACD